MQTVSIRNFGHKYRYVLRDLVKKNPTFAYCNTSGMTVTEQLIDVLEVLLTWQQTFVSWVWEESVG